MVIKSQPMQTPYHFIYINNKCVDRLSSVWDELSSVGEYPIWNVKIDLSGKTGLEVADEAYRAIKMLASLGISAIDDQINNPDGTVFVKEWKDGVAIYVEERMPEKERQIIFVKHLRRLMLKGLSRPQCVFTVETKKQEINTC